MLKEGEVKSIDILLVEDNSGHAKLIIRGFNRREFVEGNRTKSKEVLITINNKAYYHSKPPK